MTWATVTVMGAINEGKRWQSRFDRGELMRPFRRADGTILVEGFAAREGVLEYRIAGGGVHREYVPASTLADSAGELGRAPVTLGHPDPELYADSKVTPENFAQLGVGDTDGDVAVEAGGFVRVRLAIRRSDAIDAVDAGTHELSPGYDALIDPTPGVHPTFGRYDAVQVARRYNHLAIVDTARGGAEVQFRADGSLTTTIRGAAPRTEPRMFVRLLAMLGITRRLDGDSEAMAAIEAAVQSLVEALAAAKAQTTEATVAADEATARADAAEAKLAKLLETEAARADAADRAQLEAVAVKVGLDPKAHATSTELRRAVAATQVRGTLRADASDDYLRALVDMAGAEVVTTDAEDAGRKVWANTRVDGERKSAPSARERYFAALGIVS